MLCFLFLSLKHQRWVLTTLSFVTTMFSVAQALFLCILVVCHIYELSGFVGAGIRPRIITVCYAT